MTVTGYFIKQSGELWALIEQDERYGQRVALDNVSYERVSKLYWRYMRRLHADAVARERRPQPTLFPLVEDSRPSAQRKAADRYLQPSLFD